ncbi:uncharacterized protein J3R85_009749 [Psidium guajava]|nr:uncharacterized protein J3R85_009749 [Psidium guajava]
MFTRDSVQAPAVEALVDADSAQVPLDDDGEDALSLCDLSLYCDASDYSFADDDASTSSSSSASSSSSSDPDDFFEFSSIGDSDSNTDPRADDRGIVFCGKLIPRRGSPPYPPPPAPAPEKKRSKPQTGGGSQKSTSRSTRSPTARRRKCRWYLMAFGLARFPTDMALSEMRTRQRRGIQKMGPCGGGGETVRSGDSGDKSNGKGLFGLLKALGLGHRRRADALVKASLGCVPRV